MAHLCFLPAGRLIALFWESLGRPSKTQWTRQMLLSPPLEKVTDISKGKQDMFEKGLGTIYRLCEVYGLDGWIKT